MSYHNFLGAWLFACSLLCSLTSHANETLSDPSYEFVGFHLIASYQECDLAKLTDLEGLQEAMLQAVVASGATLLSSSSHIFPPHGLTLVMLLSESHASIHTYPEFNACFVDFFTCGRNCSSTSFDSVLREYLNPKTVSSRLLYRDKENVTIQ